MAAILHNLEERRGSNAVQNCMISAVFRWTIRSVPFCSVQRFLARTSRHPLDVRPQPLTPYVQAPFERTSTEPRTYVHRFFCRRNWRSVVFCLHLITLRSRVFANAAWFTCFYRILRAFTNVKKKVKYKKTDPNDTCGYHLWAKSIKVSSINCSAFFRNSDLVVHPK